MARPRILLTRRWPAAVESHLRERYDVVVDPEDRPLDSAALIEAMRSFDAICPTVSDKIDEAVLSAPGARARLLASYGAGLDHIDLSAARKAGIVVTNTPDAVTDATADLALLLMLMTSRRAGEGERELRSGRWSGWRPTHLIGQSLRGKTLGLVGFGRIAIATATRARTALGMNILYHSRSRADAAREQPVGARYAAALDQLAVEADVLSLHCPGGEATHHLVNAALLAKMKSSAILINTARGSVVDEDALASALTSGRLAGAGLDVYGREPAVSPRLLALENVVLLPHLGSATEEARVAMGLRVAANLDDFFAGRIPKDHVG